MDSCIIQLTAATHKHGNLNICCCGKNFFPSDVFGGSSRSKGIGVPITLKVKGLSESIKTDIPTDKKTGKPRWLFRERAWIKLFLSAHKLIPGDTLTISRIGKRTYKITPDNNKTKAVKHKMTSNRYYKTNLGQIYLGDSLKILEKTVNPATVDLIVTSPPFGLVRKKNYGNVDADKYVEWFKPYKIVLN